MKKKELGITEGEVSVIADITYPSLHQIWSNIGDKETFPTYIANTCYAIQSEQNASLIADAFNTANKCGLLPSELLDQRDELLEICKLLKMSGAFDYAKKNFGYSNAHWTVRLERAINQIEQ